ncbi:MAG: hypothetical protein KKG99_05520 [Bacteroidetes bacterium]|nr:hypothetical protein [Bacteroidota bacterium]
MKIWEIIIYVLLFGTLIYFTVLRVIWENKNKFNMPLFTDKQRHELLDKLGPESVSSALEILKRDYNYGWNNLLKASAILGDATGLDEDEAVNQLISNLSVKEPNLVTISAISLGKLRNARALPFLLKLIDSQPSQSEIESEKSLRFQKTQREAYAKRLGANLMNHPNIPSAYEQHEKIREAVMWAIQEINSDELAKAERYERIRSGKNLDVSDAFEVFKHPDLFKDEIHMVSSMALTEARGTDIPRAIQQLISNLDHKNMMLVDISVIALGRIADSSVIPRLKKLLADRSWEDSSLEEYINASINEIQLRK